MVKTILMIKSDYLKFIKKHEVPGKPIINKIDKLNKFYLPLSDWLYMIYKKDKRTKLIGLSGGQGAGKSTITGILKSSGPITPIMYPFLLHKEQLHLITLANPDSGTTTSASTPPQ